VHISALLCITLSDSWVTPVVQTVPGVPQGVPQVPGGPVKDSKGLAQQTSGRPTGPTPKKSYEEVHGKVPPYTPIPRYAGFSVG